MPILISAAVTMGVAALLFLQVLYGRLFFVSSVLMASLWLAVVPLLILAYYSAYVIAFRGGSASAWWSWGVATILLVVGFIYSNNMSLMLRPEAFRGMYLASARGLHLNLRDPSLMPRFLHRVTGAMAVSSLAIAALGVARRRADPAFGGWAVQYGCTWFAASTIFNIVFGIWYLASLPSYALRPLVGEDLLGTALLAAGILGGAVSLAFVMAAAQSRRPGRALGGAATSLTVTIVLMIATRDLVRRTMATAAGFEWPLWVAPQWLPIALFAALLAGAIALIGWMVVTFVKSGAQPVEARRSVRL